MEKRPRPRAQTRPPVRRTRRSLAHDPCEGPAPCPSAPTVTPTVGSSLPLPPRTLGDGRSCWAFPQVWGVAGHV